MVKKMLIDASHSEEMRVAVVDGTRLDELDIETSTKKQLKGNIYLAKVARVEPSLQAAFVDYGGNRHGFLAFNEIHPDYYQIPVADREALKEAMLAEQGEDDENEEQQPEQEKRSRRRGRRSKRGQEETENASVSEGEEDSSQQAVPERVEPAPEMVAEDAEDNGDNDDDNAEERTVETVSGNDTDEPVSRPRFHQLKRYKIQEVIHRGQVLLVQVTKEERGNKGAALTTYLSLAGRYCVLMPNNSRGGGVSRKITNAADRKRLKSVISELPLPAGMSVIVRTAGKERTKLEIRRDYEYLIKTWVQVRDKTMESSAPCLIHEEGNLIKRALRDMYTRDISEILIEGDAEYRMAKDFMKILTPSHAKKVQQYKEDVPLFFRYQVEPQLESLHSNIVQLKSGAYLVMDQTEALVAIDVNSGRATKERNIEETALKTNLEAADEIARQLRLRDMAGLVVIDFIDMEEARNNHAVERRMKEALKRDRARVQMGRITGFGLMELSRQRLHSSFLETSYTPCPHCRGKGLIRSTESASIHTLHLLEEEGIKRRFSEIRLTVPTAVALYVLNQKRADLAKIEERYKMRVSIEGDDALLNATDYRIERVAGTGDAPELRAEPREEASRQEDEEEAPVAKKGREKGRDKGRDKGRRSRREARNNNAEPAVQVIEEPKDAEDSWVIQEDVISLDDGDEIIQADEMFEEGLKASARPPREERPENSETSEQDEQNDRSSHRSRRPRRGDRRFSKRRRDRNENGSSEDALNVSETRENQEAQAAQEASADTENTEAVITAVEEGDVDANRRRSPSHRRRMRPHTRPRRQKAQEFSAEEGKTEAEGAHKQEDNPVILYESHPVKTENAPANEAPAVSEAKEGEASSEPSKAKRKGWWQKLVK